MDDEHIGLVKPGLSATYTASDVVSLTASVSQKTYNFSDGLKTVASTTPGNAVVRSASVGVSVSF